MLEFLTAHKYAIGGVALLGGGFLYVKSKQAANKSRSKASQAANSNDALLAPTISSYPMSSLSGLGGGGGGSSGGADQGGMMSQGGYSTGLPATNTGSSSQMSIFDSMLKLAGLNNDFALAKGKQSNDFNLAMTDKQTDFGVTTQKTGGLFDLGKLIADFGGSVDVTGNSIKVVHNASAPTLADNKAAQDKNFITSLYQSIAGKSADKIDSGGMAYWLNQTSRNVSYDDVVHNFTAATKDVQAGDFVSSLYTKIGNKAPDAPGVNYWKQQVLSGTSQDQVTKNFDSAVAAAKTATV